jgi:hypothetical protein
MSEKYETEEELKRRVIQLRFKDKELEERVLSIIDKIFSRKEELWGYIQYNLKMVDHGEKHTRNVVNLLSRFLVYSQPKLLNELTDMEKFCLLFAVWFHDIGGRGLPEKDKKFLDFLYTRGEHPWVGEEIFRTKAPSFGFSEEERDIIGEIIPAHSSRENIDKLPKVVSVNKQKVRPRLLASILSFVDACDTQRRRVGGEEGVEDALKANETGKNEEEEKLEKVKEELEEKKKQYEMLKLQHKQEEILKLENKIKELEEDKKLSEAYIHFYKEAPKHFYKHLSVKEVYFTPESVILEPNYYMRVVYPERKPFTEYFNLALEDIRKEFERVKKYFNEYGITIREIRACNEKDDMEKLREQLEPPPPSPTPPPPTNIPDFYGREEELDDIYMVITDKNRAYTIFNVFGSGGIGKTAFVEVLLLRLREEYPVVWEVGSTEGRATTFSIPDNYKIGTLKFPSIRGLVQLLGIEAKENIEDSLINWLDDNKVVLFIDDFQKLGSDFKDFINKAYNKLRNGKIIIASRGRADVSCHLYKELSELKKDPCKEMIRNELKKASFEPKEEIVNLIYEKTKGHPLATKMLVSLISRYKLSFERVREFGSIKDVRNEKEVKEFISRIFLENIKDERDRNVFKYLSLLKDGFDYDILRAILKVLKDERYKWEDEKLHREFLSQFMPHIIISHDDKRKIFNFKHDMIKEAVYSQVENAEKAREKILKALREMDEKLSEDKKAFMNEEIFYQAEILKHRGENKELMKVAFESSKMLANYAYGRLPLMTYEYGKKALSYAEKLEKWIELLNIAEHVLFYAYELLIAVEETRILYNKVDEVFPKALKLNQDLARYHYAIATAHWAFYALNSLNNPEEAGSSIEKALKEVGSKDSRLIKDELLWYEAYSLLLLNKADLLQARGKIKEALSVLEERDELLETYKDKIVNRWGEKSYYKSKSVIMNRLAILTLDAAQSEDDLKKAQEYEKNSIIYELRAENRPGAATSRTNLALIQIMLAKNQDDIKKANEKVEGINLEDCIKIFEEVGDKNGEALAYCNIAIYCLALKNDEDAKKFAEDSIEIVKNGPDEYLKAEFELTLAYIKMTSRLSDFKKGKLFDEVHELIQDAYEKFKKIRASSQFIALAVEAIAKYLQKEINFDGLLKELDGLTKELELAENLEIMETRMSELWILKQLINSIKKKGDIDEDLLRLEGIKLLLTLK